jgi:hypothetical protein
VKAESDVKNLLRHWIHTASKKAELPPIADDTAIIEQRIITSLQVMDLLLYIEQLTNEPLDAGDLKPGSLKDINTIYKNFFGGNNDN